MANDNKPRHLQEIASYPFKKVSSFKTFSQSSRSLQKVRNQAPAVLAPALAPIEDHHHTVRATHVTNASTQYEQAPITAEDDEAQEDTIMQDPSPMEVSPYDNDIYMSEEGEVSDSAPTTAPSIRASSDIITRQIEPTSSTASSNRRIRQQSLTDYLETGPPTVNAPQSSHAGSQFIDDATQRYRNSGHPMLRQDRAGELERIRKRVVITGIMKRMGNWINPRAQLANRNRPKAEDLF
ncbi:MAG: hypothetical protein M1812_003271 [Candelaria pacifica]|nr:MAG: hypothetical protein M1812_003271 [Candelaria pacifica]